MDYHSNSWAVTTASAAIIRINPSKYNGTYPGCHAPLLLTAATSKVGRRRGSQQMAGNVHSSVRCAIVTSSVPRSVVVDVQHARYRVSEQLLHRGAVVVAARFVLFQTGSGAGCARGGVCRPNLQERNDPRCGSSE